MVGRGVGRGVKGVVVCVGGGVCVEGGGGHSRLTFGHEEHRVDREYRLGLSIVHKRRRRRKRGSGGQNDSSGGLMQFGQQVIVVIVVVLLRR